MAEKTNKTSESFLSIADLWHLCIARWRWFVVSIAICLLFAVRHLMTAPYLYSRSATIMLREDVTGNNATDRNSKDFNDIGFVKQKNKVTDVVRHFMSLDVLMEVAMRSGKPMADDDVFSVAEDIQSRLSVESDGPESNIINLTYQDTSTAEAERVLTLILNVYNEKWIRDKQEIIRSTSRFIDSKLELLESELSIVDDSISAYKSRYGITEIENVSNIYLQQQSQADAEILKLMNQKAMAEYIRSLLEDEASQQQLLLVNSGINNTLIESQITLYNNLLLQMQSHMEYTSGQNPLMMNLEKELNSLRKNILSNVVNHIRTIDIQLKSLEDYHGETSSKISSKPNQAKHLISIEREQKVKESLYLYLLQKKEENEISLTYQSAPSRVIDIPHGKGKPTSPKRMRILFAALLLGGMIPLIIIFLCATMNESVRDRHDIERLDVPFLGEVPFSERRSTLQSLLRRVRLKPACDPIVVGADKQSPVNEAFRLIRTRLNAIHDGHPHHNVYMVTSTEDAAGKTFVSMNLALALAIAGKRVLFIDGDLRKRAASLRWNAPTQGLADYLNGSVTELKPLFFQPDGFHTLDVLSAGTLQPNPTELLDRTRLEELIGQLQPQYDFVIIDTPSSAVLADAEIIGRHADQNLFVVRSGVFKRHRLAELAEPTSQGISQYVILNGVIND